MKQYSNALPWFAKAVQEQPHNPKSYYYLGYCQFMTGDFKDAAVNFYLSDGLKSNLELKSFADQTKSKLPTEDQKWVADQTALGSSHPPSNLPPMGSSGQKKEISFGLRFTSDMLFLNLSDFNSFLRTRQYWGGVYQAATPSITVFYSVPWLGVVTELNPYFPIWDSWEIGLNVAYLFLDPASYHYDAPSLYYFNHWDYHFDVWEMGLNFRWHLLKAQEGNVGLFLEPGFGFLPVSLTFEQNYQNANYSVPTDDYGANTSSSALAASLKAGFTLKFKKDIALSFSAGYQYAPVTGFTGTYWDKTGYRLDGKTGSLQLYTDPSNGQSSIIFIPDDHTLLTNFHENQSTLDNSRPLSLDLSGFKTDAEFSFLF